MSYGMGCSPPSAPSGGIGLIGLLTVLFIGLKLTHFIAWSWWWVLAPMWIVASLSVALVVVFLAAVAFIVIVGDQ